MIQQTVRQNLSFNEIRELEKHIKSKRTLYQRIENKKMKPDVQFIQSTERFEHFISEVKRLFRLRGVTEFKYSELEKVETICYETNLWNIHLTTLFKVKTNEFTLNLSPINDGIHLHLIRVTPYIRRKGIGSMVVQTLRTISNNLEIPIYLIPLSLQGEHVNINNLNKFYHQNGYKRESNSRYWKYEPNTLIGIDSEILKMVS